MTAPVTYNVLDSLRTRLEAISLSSGYNTDAGDRVYLGRQRVNPDQVDIGPVLNIYDTADEVDEGTGYGYEAVHSRLFVTVEAFVRDFDDEGLALAHLVFQDIFNAALDATDMTLSGTALDIGYEGREIEYPEPGGDTISVAVNFSILIELPYGNI